MPKFVDSLLLKNRQRREQRFGLLDDHLRADMGLPSAALRRVQPFVLGSLIFR